MWKVCNLSESQTGPTNRSTEFETNFPFFTMAYCLLYSTWARWQYVFCFVYLKGMFSNYLHRAAEHMTANSNKQQSQTGTQLSSFTSGYNGVDSNREVPSSLNGQSAGQYLHMVGYILIFFKNCMSMLFNITYLNYLFADLIGKKLTVSHCDSEWLAMTWVDV